MISIASELDSASIASTNQAALSAAGFKKDPVEFGNIKSIETHLTLIFNLPQFKLDMSLYYSNLLISLPLTYRPHFEAVFPNAESFVQFNVDVLLLHLLRLEGVRPSRINQIFERKLFVFKVLADIISALPHTYNKTNR
jgi:hypothetical protein